MQTITLQVAERLGWCLSVMLQVPFLTRQSEAVLGQSVVLEALGALYNICKFNKKVHLEVAATAGIIPHLCRWGRFKLPWVA